MPHYIDDESKKRLLAYCGLQEHQDLPWDVEEAFWRFKHYWDRANGGRRPDDTALCYMAMTSVEHAPTEEEKNPKPTVHSHPPKRDDLVQVRWRGKEVLANFKSISSNGKYVHVVIDGDAQAEERAIKVENVEILEDQPAEA
jgi:hypothetical protein